MQDLTVVCIAFRQNELINAAIGSIEKNLKSANIVKYLIIDNSAIVQFKILEDICGQSAASKIEIVKNYIGYDKRIHFYRDYSHSKGILKAIELCKTDLMLLVDHDIILKNDIDFIDDVVCNDDVIGAFGIRAGCLYDIKAYVRRACPFLMLLDVSKLRKYNIKFYDDRYSKSRSVEDYCTGLTFLKNIEQSKNFKYKYLNLDKYINHYLHGHQITKEKLEKYLNDNKVYYCNDDYSKNVIAVKNQSSVSNSNVVKTNAVCFSLAGQFEDTYIDEWISYYLKIGFKKLIIFTYNWKYNRQHQFDNSHVQFIEVNNNNLKSNFSVKQLDNDRTNLINDYIKNSKEKFDLVANFDIDEFLWFFDLYHSIDEFYDAVKDSCFTYVNWRFFESSYTQKFDKSNASVLKRFTKCSKNCYFLGKTMITAKGLSENVKYVSPHSCNLNYRHAQNVSMPVYLAHYMFKTQEEDDVRRFYYDQLTMQKRRAKYTVAERNLIDNFSLRNFMYEQSASYTIENLFEHSLLIHLKNNICRENSLKFILNKFQLPFPKIFEFTVDYRQLQLMLDNNIDCKKFDNKLFLSFAFEYNLDISKYVNAIKTSKMHFNQIKKNKEDYCLKTVSCILSHLLCIYYAKLNNWPYVLVLEDDICPSKNAKDTLMNVIHKIDLATNKDIILLGYGIIDENLKKAVSESNEEIIKIDSKNFNDVEKLYFHGMHSYIVPCCLFDKILDTFTKNYAVINENFLFAGDEVLFIKDKIFCQLNFLENIEYSRVAKPGIYYITCAQNFKFPFNKHQLHCIHKTFFSK